MNDRYIKIAKIVGILFCITIIGYQYASIREGDAKINDQVYKIRELEQFVRVWENKYSELQDYLTDCQDELTVCQKNLQINRSNNSILQQEKQSLETQKFFGW